jgi:hypothetical protein
MSYTSKRFAIRTITNGTVVIGGGGNYPTKSKAVSQAIDKFVDWCVA